MGKKRAGTVGASSVPARYQAFPREWIAISQIVVDADRRAIQRPGLEGLAASIGENGQLQPIAVLRVPGGRFRLVFGWHRVQALMLLKRSHVDAIIMDVDRAQAELAEIDENLCRVELDELQRSEAAARRKEIYEALHPETKRGAKGGRKAAGKGGEACDLCGGPDGIVGGIERGKLDRAARSNSAPSFVADAAAKTGQHPGTISRQAKLGRELPEEVKKVVRGTKLAKINSELQALLRVAKQRGPEMAASAARTVLAGEAPTVKAAVEEPQPADEEASAVLREMLQGLKASWRKRCGDAATAQLAAAVLHCVADLWVQQNWGKR